MLEKFAPKEVVLRLCEIDIDALLARGIDTILLDLDNTITPWRSLDIPDDLAEWLEEAKQKTRVVIVSNTSKMTRLDAIKERLGIEGLGFASKPWGLKKAVSKFGVDPEKAVAVGDQLLTDIYGGNLAGCYTILVKPVSDDEFFGTLIMRVVERAVFRGLKRRKLFDRPW